MENPKNQLLQHHKNKASKHQKIRPTTPQTQHHQNASHLLGFPVFQFGTVTRHPWPDSGPLSAVAPDWKFSGIVYQWPSAPPTGDPLLGFSKKCCHLFPLLDSVTVPVNVLQLPRLSRGLILGLWRWSQCSDSLTHYQHQMNSPTARFGPFVCLWINKHSRLVCMSARMDRGRGLYSNARSSLFRVCVLLKKLTRRTFTRLTRCFVLSVVSWVLVSGRGCGCFWVVWGYFYTPKAPRDSFYLSSA